MRCLTRQILRGKVAAQNPCCPTLNVEPFRVRMLRQTACVSVARFDHPSGIVLPTAFSTHDAAEHFRVNVVERGWFRLRYGRREWTLGAGSMFLSRPTEVYGYSHVKYAEPDTCLRVEFYGPVAGELAESVFRLPLVPPKTNRLSFLRLRLGSLLSNAAEMSLDALACELVDAAANADHDRHPLYRSGQLRWYAERIGAARELMDCDPTADHSLWHLSSQVGMSIFLFARVFRELVGMPPHQYLVHRRLHRARDLLRSGMSVTDACYAAGFNNLSHFIRTFRAYFGMLPSKFKPSPSAPAARSKPLLQ
jgi:AraC-like DNA-binding protein